jgi:anti-sigma factor RsiW
MSKCQDLDPLFAPYVDGEAASCDRTALESHMERCPPCRERLDAERAAHDLLAAHRPQLRVCASERLRATCAAYANQHAGAPAASRASAGIARRWLPLSLAATLILAIAGAFVYGLNDSVEALTTQLTLDHVRCFQFAPERRDHADPLTAGRVWTAAHGWALHVPPGSAARELELLGVRRCLVTEGGVAHVMYKWHGQPLSVFVVPRTIRGANELRKITESFGHEAMVWPDGDRTYAVVARGHPADLEGLAAYVKANAH